MESPNEVVNASKISKGGKTPSEDDKNDDFQKNSILSDLSPGSSRNYIPRDNLLGKIKLDKEILIDQLDLNVKNRKPINKINIEEDCVDFVGHTFHAGKFTSNINPDRNGICNGNMIVINPYNQHNNNLCDSSDKNNLKLSENGNSENIQYNNNQLIINPYQQSNPPGKYTSNNYSNNNNNIRNEVSNENFDINAYNQQVYYNNKNSYKINTMTQSNNNMPYANHKYYGVANLNLQSHNNENDRLNNFNNSNSNFQAYPNYQRHIMIENPNNYVNLNTLEDAYWRKNNAYSTTSGTQNSNSINNKNKYNQSVSNNINAFTQNSKHNQNKNYNNKKINQQQHIATINQVNKNLEWNKLSSNNFLTTHNGNNKHNEAYLNNLYKNIGLDTEIRSNQKNHNIPHNYKNQYLPSNNGEMTKNGTDINPIIKNLPDNFENNISSNSIKQGSIHTSVMKNKKFERFQKLNMKFEDMSEEELAQLSLPIAKDQVGCRFLQKKVEESPKYTNEILFPEIFNDLLEFMMDSFGNYLIQKIIENLNEINFETILNLINQPFLHLGLNQHGTRIIQKVIECLKSKKHFDFFNKIFEPNISELIKDVNGNHIIIKYVSTINFPDNDILFRSVGDNIIEFATNKHSCCAFQKCLNFGTNQQVINLIEKIVDNTLILLSDPYGNYLLQYVIMMNNYETNYKITMYFRNKIRYLSKQKFSSNVIEKCFDHSDSHTIDILVEEICNEKFIVDLLFDMYGNYGKLIFI